MKYFEKKAAGPVIYKMTDADVAQNPALAGKYIPKKEIAKNPDIAKNLDPSLKSLKKGLLIERSAGDFPNTKLLSPNQQAKVVRDHELTHYIRDRKGKMNRLGDKGILGVGSTMREELIAHKRSTKSISIPLKNKVKGILGGTLESTRLLYPQGILKAILKLK
jgi:hypothetical protein